MKKQETKLVIGERIKRARQAKGFSLRTLANLVGLSHQAIHKYENNQDIPSSDVLLKLSNALEVPWEYFFRPIQVGKLQPAYRSQKRFAIKNERMILFQIEEWLERYLELEELFPQEKFHHKLPEIPAQTPEEAEQAAEKLRQIWNLGFDPIENLVETLEDKGVKVGLVDGAKGFDAVAFCMEDGTPVIAVAKSVPGDRQRFSIAHELGYLVMGLWSDSSETEKLANRFAGAFLAPASSVRAELGDKRRFLSLEELSILKKKYRLSMQAWIYRARDLGIISETKAQQLYAIFRKKGYHLQEPVSIPSEIPSRFERLIHRALAEELISDTKAHELLALSGFSVGGIKE
ncbi:XRE family transcriptional regulator [Carboxydothermus ferrireducens]|uniref:Zn-dependent peptidase ImmA (M78 family)/DNA-binding XRE family transcriptional regulator n=1 Tax=Carboxydothermus ferrireducens DSM 11255 TaxID=1119529 RepID=A0ABX2RAY8_9THEO|nr:XRE family transcriptional regulator [Carboxydothermus ferrireducens]NYE57757.1 Zn-dependent peptidase ImmA (M78 family)/DNA-binding XRE family transcriptional regulator [Carboxydothermus ferrireducens DSM 11255]